MRQHSQISVCNQILYISMNLSYQIILENLTFVRISCVFHTCAHEMEAQVERSASTYIQEDSTLASTAASQQGGVRSGLMG